MEYLKNFYKGHKKLSIVLFVIFGYFLLARGAHLLVQHQVETGKWVEYNGKWYFTEKQLRKDFPPQYIDVPAKNTPEEVYAGFRQALLNNEIDVALAYVRKENRASQRDALVKFGDLVALGNIYPEKITQEKIEGNFAQYNYSFLKNGKEINSIILFGKDTDGYWKLDI